MWLDYLSDLGYSNYTQVLNAKDYGVPQNRERVFVVSVLGEDTFAFPECLPLCKNINSILEDKIDECFYLDESKIQMQELSENKMFVKYTRDRKGKVVNRRLSCVSNTIKTNTGSGGNTDCFVFEPNGLNRYRIRKLTPRECFRLMGVSDTDIDKIQAAGISKTQQYKMDGNSIVVDVLCHIFRKMFVDKGNEDKQLSLF